LLSLSLSRARARSLSLSPSLELETAHACRHANTRCWQTRGGAWGGKPELTSLSMRYCGNVFVDVKQHM
jgi:hypothetical protein